MRKFLALSICLLLTCCSSEESTPPEIDIKASLLDPEAATVIEKAQLNVESLPTSMQAWQQYGKLIHAHGLDEQAKLAYAYANTLQQTSETTYLQALVCADLGDYEQAITLCEEISTYTPALWRDV